MLESVGSDLAHVVHISVFLDRVSDFEAMNAATSNLESSDLQQDRVCVHPATFF